MTIVINVYQFVFLKKMWLAAILYFVVCCFLHLDLFLLLERNLNVLTVSISPWHPWSDHAARSRKWERRMHDYNRRELRHLLQGSCVGPAGISSWWASTALQTVPLLTAAFSLTVHHHPGTDSTPCVYAHTQNTDCHSTGTYVPYTVSTSQALLVARK